MNGTVNWNSTSGEGRLLDYIPTSLSLFDHKDIINATHSTVLLNTTKKPVDPRGPFYAPYYRSQILESYYVTHVCYPFLLALCTVGNCLTLWVFGSSKTKLTTRIYMMTVAVANLWILWLYMPVYLKNLAFSKPAPQNDAYTLTFFNFMGLQQWGNDTFIHLSDWTLIVFSLERLLAIVNPLTFMRFQSAKYAKIWVAILLILAGMATFFDVFDYYYVQRAHKLDTYISKSANYTKPVFRQTSAAYKEWETVQHRSEVTITLLKFFLLLLINVWLIIVLKKVTKFAGTKTGDKDKAANQQRHTIRLLLGSVALYIITQFPTVVFNILSVMDEKKKFVFLPGHQFMMAPCIFIVQLINYSANFLIYVTVSDQFRLQLSKLLNEIRCWRVLKQRTDGFVQRSPFLKKMVNKRSSAAPAVKKPAKKQHRGPSKSIVSVDSVSAELSVLESEPDISPRNIRGQRGLGSMGIYLADLGKTLATAPDATEVVQETNIDPMPNVTRKPSVTVSKRESVDNGRSSSSMPKPDILQNTENASRVSGSPFLSRRVSDVHLMRRYSDLPVFQDTTRRGSAGDALDRSENYEVLLPVVRPRSRTDDKGMVRRRNQPTVTTESHTGNVVMNDEENNAEFAAGTLTFSGNMVTML